MNQPIVSNIQSPKRRCATLVFKMDRSVIAICEHIAAKKALPSAAVAVRVQEPLDDGVIVTGLEVIPASVLGMAVNFSCYLGDKAVEIIVFFSVFLVAGFLAGTTIQGLS